VFPAAQQSDSGGGDVHGRRVRPASFMALGDSFTEGMDDPYPDGSYRGWADLLAQRLAALPGPEFHYANLAVRGRKVDEVLDEQLPVALATRPELVSFAAGINDAMRPSFDLDHVVAAQDHAVRSLREARCEVLLICYGDPSRRSAVVGRLSERIRSVNVHTRQLARDTDCKVMDFWGEPLFDDPRCWSSDRLHLSELGHSRVAHAAAEALGLGDGRWRAPLPPAQPQPWVSRRRDDLDWAITHFGPWLARRVRGQSSGEGIEPKRPTLAPLSAPTGATDFDYAR
jgi:lysophospholipase L1-like esterase